MSQFTDDAAAEADWADQHADDDEAPEEVDLTDGEADPADRMDQQTEAPLDDEDYPQE